MIPLGGGEAERQESDAHSEGSENLKRPLKKKMAVRQAGGSGTHDTAGGRLAAYRRPADGSLTGRHPTRGIRGARTKIHVSDSDLACYVNT